MNFNYAIKIESADTDPIEINENQSIITDVEIFIDTIDDNVRQKASGMLARLTVIGKIDVSIQDQLIGLFDWSKDLDSDNWYRNVELKIFESKKLQRTYEFPNMFVVDYKELYHASGEQKEGTFELYLTQKDNNFEGIKTY